MGKVSGNFLSDLSGKLGTGFKETSDYVPTSLSVVLSEAKDLVQVRTRNGLSGSFRRVTTILPALSTKLRVK